MIALLAMAVAIVWIYAIVVYPELPAEIPMHFGISGEPDRWADKSVWAWFLLPAMATVFAIGLGWVVPRWVRALARSNSKMLNVPDAARFRALATEARMRVVDTMVSPLRSIGLWIVLLLGWASYGMAQVALGHWQRLALWPTLVAIAAIIGVSVWASIAAKAAVRRELT